MYGSMKKTLLLFVAIATMFASCTKQELVLDCKSANNIKLNISVSSLEDNTSSTKAMVKTGWANGDRISIWFDSNVQSNPDLVIKYNGTTWENDTDATVSGNTPAASGNLKAVFNGAVIVSAKDSYTYESSTLSATISNWTYLTEIQVVLTGLSSSNASKYTLSCNRITSLASSKYTVGADEITANAVVKGGTVTGIANEDGVAFVFATTDSYGSEADYKFYLSDATGTPVVSKSFTASAKTLTNTPGKIKGIKIDASKFSVISATNLSASETANTYIVSSSGTYCIDATTKGNGGLDPLTGTTATKINGIAGVKVLWELYSQGRAIKYNASEYDVFYCGGNIFFSSPDTFVPGDACVAVVDSDGNILWSWLIWATPAPGTMTYNTKTFMDRNLGAINVGNCMRGFLYEWGRKDAFSAANGGYSQYTFIPDAATVFSDVKDNKTMQYAISNPTIYIWKGGSWMLESEYTAKPWRDDVKTIYDPCPIGWRVPRKGDLNNYGSFPATGLRDFQGGINGFGNPGTGYAWYSTTDEGADPKAYAFVNDHRKDTPQHWSHDQGYAIRPVRE